MDANQMFVLESGTSLFFKIDNSDKLAELNAMLENFNATTRFGMGMNYLTEILSGGDFSASTEDESFKFTDRERNVTVITAETIDPVEYTTKWTPLRDTLLGMTVNKHTFGAYMEYIGFSKSAFVYTGNGNSFGKSSGAVPDKTFNIAITDCHVVNNIFDLNDRDKEMMAYMGVPVEEYDASADSLTPDMKTRIKIFGESIPAARMDDEILDNL